MAIPGRPLIQSMITASAAKKESRSVMCIKPMIRISDPPQIRKMINGQSDTKKRSLPRRQWRGLAISYGNPGIERNALELPSAMD